MSEPTKPPDDIHRALAELRRRIDVVEKNPKSRDRAEEIAELRRDIDAVEAKARSNKFTALPKTSQAAE